MTVTAVGMIPAYVERLLAGRTAPRSAGQGSCATNWPFPAVDAGRAVGHVIAEQGDADGD